MRKIQSVESIKSNETVNEVQSCNSPEIIEEYYCTWCSASYDEMDYIEEITKEYHNKMKILGIDLRNRFSIPGCTKCAKLDQCSYKEYLEKHYFEDHSFNGENNSENDSENSLKDDIKNKNDLKNEDNLEDKNSLKDDVKNKNDLKNEDNFEDENSLKDDIINEDDVKKENSFNEKKNFKNENNLKDENKQDDFYFQLLNNYENNEREFVNELLNLYDESEDKEDLIKPLEYDLNKTLKDSLIFIDEKLKENNDNRDFINLNPVLDYYSKESKKDLIEDLKKNDEMKSKENSEIKLLQNSIMKVEDFNYKNKLENDKSFIDKSHIKIEDSIKNKISESKVSVENHEPQKIKINFIENKKNKELEYDEKQKRKCIENIKEPCVENIKNCGEKLDKTMTERNIKNIINHNENLNIDNIFYKNFSNHLQNMNKPEIKINKYSLKTDQKIIKNGESINYGRLKSRDKRFDILEEAEKRLNRVESIPKIVIDKKPVVFIDQSYKISDFKAILIGKLNKKNRNGKYKENWFVINGNTMTCYNGKQIETASENNIENIRSPDNPNAYLSPKYSLFLPNSRIYLVHNKKSFFCGNFNNGLLEITNFQIKDVIFSKNRYIIFLKTENSETKFETGILEFVIGHDNNFYFYRVKNETLFLKWMISIYYRMGRIRLPIE